MSTKVYYSDDDIKGFVQTIARAMSIDMYRPDYIVGLTRGGLVPATMLSHYLDVPLHTLNVSFRDGDIGPESNLWMAEDAFGTTAPAKKILIVDDINDSGATLDWIKQDWPAGCFPHGDRWNTLWHDTVKFATLINNEASAFKNVDYVGKYINKNDKPEWCVFPWENWWE